jgi:hypothetical protein
MRHILSKLCCLLTGHRWRETDIYHIEYLPDEDDYSVDSWYVTVCSRCGKRHA